MRCFSYFVVATWGQQNKLCSASLPAQILDWNLQCNADRNIQTSNQPFISLRQTGDQSALSLSLPQMITCLQNAKVPPSHNDVFQVDCRLLWMYALSPWLPFIVCIYRSSDLLPSMQLVNKLAWWMALCECVRARTAPWSQEWSVFKEERVVWRCFLLLFPLYSTVAVSFNYLWQWASWILIIPSLVFPGALHHSLQQRDALARSSPLHPKLIGFFSPRLISWHLLGVKGYH